MFGAVVARLVEVEDLVVDPDDPALPGADVAPSPHTLGRGGRGEIERPRHRRTPVHQHRCVVVVVIEEADASDVAGSNAGVVEVKPAEAPTLLDGVELGDLLTVLAGRAVALGARL